MRSGHLFWAKNRLADDVIDLQALFNDYWGSNNYEFTVPSQFQPPPSPLVSDNEAQRTLLSLESIIAIVGLWNYDSLQALPFVSL